MSRGTRPHLRPPEEGAVLEEEDFARVEWDWTELSGVTFTRCRFDDASLSELVTRRCVFDACVLTGVLLGGSRHSGSAFLSCRFDRAKLLDVRWEGCKLTGSQFPGAELRPRPSAGSRRELASGGGQGVLHLRGASTDAVNWRGLDVHGVRLDLVQSVQFARAHGAFVADQGPLLPAPRKLAAGPGRRPHAAVVVPYLGPVSSAFSEPSRPRTATAIAK